MSETTTRRALPLTCRCGAQWSGVARCHCTGCHRLFSGITAFDLHRRNGKCNRPPDVGLVDRAGIWGYPGNDDRWEE